MSKKVLDSWALLAWIGGEEPAASKIHRLLSRAAKSGEQPLMSIVNFGEVYYILGKRRGVETADEYRRRIASAPITFVSASDERVWAAAELKALYEIAYADAFAAALTVEHDATLVTGDREFGPLEKDKLISIQWLARS